MRFWRIEDMDEYASEPPSPRDAALIELVDKLPKTERYIIERLYFSGATVAVIARELDISTDVCKKLRNGALEALRGKLRS